MFGEIYLPVHSSKLMYGFKFSEFPINLSSQSTGLKHLTECLP